MEMFTKRKAATVGQNTNGAENQVSLELLSELPNLFHTAATGDVNDLKELLSTAQTRTAAPLEVDDNGASLLHHAAAHNRLAASAVLQYLIDCGLDRDASDNDGNTPLHLATIQGNTEAVHFLLGLGAKDTILNRAMEAPLHLAVRKNDAKLIQAFVCHPQVEILQPGPDKNTPIHIAAMYDSIESFKVLCESSQMAEAVTRTEGYKISSKNAEGLTALHLAARNGSHQVLELIILTSRLLGCSSGVELELFNAENITPLYSAVEAGHTEVVNILLKYGAIPTKSCGSKIPPLHLACAQGKLEMVKSMVEHCGRNILSQGDLDERFPAIYSVIAPHSSSIIAYLATNGVDLNVSEDDGGTPLHLAIKCGNLSSVRELLSRGASPLIKNDQGKNSAHFAVVYCRKKIVEILSTHKTFPQLFTDKDNEGISAILLALSRGQGNLVLPLLSSDRIELPQSMCDADRNNCLHLAAASNDWRTLRALLDLPAFADCVNAINSKAEMPLHLAAQGGEIRSIEILLSHGALTNKSLGDTALMRACLNGHSKCALKLYNAHPFQRDWKDKTGNTALHYAALGGDPKTLTAALDIGCKISKNTEGLTFVDIVIASANRKCAVVFVSHSRWQECLDYPSKCNPMIGLIEKLPTVAQQVLDRCHQCAPCDRKNAEYWERFDFKYLQPSTEKPDMLPNQKTHANSMTAARKMVKYKRIDLLAHPVVEKYITDKWSSYGVWVYLVSFTMRLIAAILLSTFILVVPNPEINADVQNSSAQVPSNGSHNSSDGELTLSESAQALRATALIVNFLLTLLVILPLTATIKKILARDNFPILVYIISILSTYIFLLAPNPTDIWVAGAIACFFSWFAVTMGLLLFKLFGIYVRMFLIVITTVFKVLFVSFFLILSFTFPFYMLAGRLPVFSSIRYSLFTLFSYMLGEVQYEEFILTDQSGSLNHSSVVFLFVIAVAILMTIAMANLLVGLAVGDIEGIRGTALLGKRKVDVLYLSHLDRSPLFQRFNKLYIVTYPNSRSSFSKRLWKCLKNVAKDEDEEEQEIANSALSATPDDHRDGCDQEEINRIRQQLEELTVLVKQLCEQKQRNCPNCREPCHH